MSKVAIEQLFNNSTTTTAYSAGYNSANVLLGQWIFQRTGNTTGTNYAGPASVVLARPIEVGPQIYPYLLSVIDVGNNTHWVFTGDGSAAGATRQVCLYVYNTATQNIYCKGSIALTPVTTDTHKLTGLRVVRHATTTGTVSVSSTAVTGVSTVFQGGGTANAAYAAGCRIGFGSTNPANITTWYTVASISSDTALTLNNTVAAALAGVSYVMEELRIYFTTIASGTPANGGLFVAKGVNFDDFQFRATIIAASSGSTDDLKLVYWLTDAGTNTITTSCGIAVAGTPTDASTTLYVVNGAATSTMRVYKFEGREALTPSSGQDTTAFTLKTNTQGSLSGTLQSSQSCSMGTPNHNGLGGASTLFVATTTNIYRIPEANITNNASAYSPDSMTEVPTGGTNTFPATGALASVEYVSTIDRFLVTPNPTTGGTKSYCTKYNSAGTAFDRTFLCDSKQQNPSGADMGLAIYPNTNTVGNTVATVNGMAYFAMSNTTTTTANTFLFAVPVGVDWDYAAGLSSASQNRIITPSLATAGCVKFYRVVVLNDVLRGSYSVGTLPSFSLGTQPEPFRVSYRTSGISDDSGTWVSVSHTGDLTDVTAANSIQFMLEFRLLGNFPIPARIYGLILYYEDGSTDSHFEPSTKLSNITSKTFVWRFAQPFEGVSAVTPTLNVSIFNADTGSSLVTDSTASPTNGTFSKSTNDGVTWGSYNTTNKTNEITYIKYTPTSLTDDIRVRAILTQ